MRIVGRDRTSWSSLQLSRCFSNSWSTLPAVERNDELDTGDSAGAAVSSRILGAIDELQQGGWTVRRRLPMRSRLRVCPGAESRQFLAFEADWLDQRERLDCAARNRALAVILA